MFPAIDLTPQKGVASSISHRERHLNAAAKFSVAPCPSLAVLEEFPSS